MSGCGDTASDFGAADHNKTGTQELKIRISALRDLRQELRAAQLRQGL